MKCWLRPLPFFSLLVLSPDALAAVLYVNVSNGAPAPPYTTWATAATNIQDAVEVASSGDQILVTNGVYQTGGQVVYGALTNRVAVTKALTVQSVNGPDVTVIQGTPGASDIAVRCVYLTNGALLAGFTLTNGGTRASGDDSTERTGGALWSESTSAVASNCLITSSSSSQWGGGAAY